VKTHVASHHGHESATRRLTVEAVHPVQGMCERFLDEKMATTEGGLLGQGHVHMCGGRDKDNLRVSIPRFVQTIQHFDINLSPKSLPGFVARITHEKVIHAKGDEILDVSSPD
jgi:hypothetical protein